MSFRRETLYDVALHEAGHAMAAHVLGFEVAGMSCWRREDGRHGGECLVREDSDRMWGQLLVILAGVAANMVIEPNAMTWLGERDINKAWGIVDRIASANKGAGDRMILTALAEARRLLDERWPAVESVAEQLHRVGQMDGPQTHCLLAEVGR